MTGIQRWADTDIAGMFLARMAREDTAEVYYYAEADHVEVLRQAANEQATEAAVTGYDRGYAAGQRDALAAVIADLNACVEREVAEGDLDGLLNGAGYAVERIAAIKGDSDEPHECVWGQGECVPGCLNCKRMDELIDERAAGYDDCLRDVREAILDYYKVAPKAAEPLLKRLPMSQESGHQDSD